MQPHDSGSTDPNTTEYDNNIQDKNNSNNHDDNHTIAATDNDNRNTNECDNSASNHKEHVKTEGGYNGRNNDDYNTSTCDTDGPNQADKDKGNKLRMTKTAAYFGTTFQQLWILIQQVEELNIQFAEFLQTLPIPPLSQMIPANPQLNR